MATLTLPGVLLTGNHASRPAATAVGTGTLYSCTTHALVYQSDGATWSTWATLGSAGALTDPMTTRGDIIVRDATNVTARLARGSADTVLTSDGTDVAYAKVLPANLDVSADNTTADATTGHHGLLPKFGGGTTNFLRADGTWNAPGGSSAYDPIASNFGTPDTAYEFDTSSFTGLTAMGSPDGEDANTSLLSHYYVKDNDSAYVGRYAAVTPAFSAIAKLSDATLRANYSHAGLFCGEATPGKMVSVNARFGDGQSVNTFTQTGPTDTSPGSPAVTDAPATPLAYPLYLGIKCVSSTDVSYYMSHTGHVWHAILLNHNNTMTVASVGIGIFILGGGTGQTSAAFDFLRIWNSAKTFLL